MRKNKEEIATMTRYFEDFKIGDQFDLGSKHFTEEEIIAFARSYDPQPFHVDPVQAKESVFGGIIASGWHTADAFMRLFVDSLLNDTISLASPGIDELRWRKPVRPGDILQARFTVIECTPSKSRPEMGVVRSCCEMLDQSNEVVMSMFGIHFLGRRSATT